MPKATLSPKMKLDFLIAFDDWAPSGGGFPWQEDDSDTMDFIENHFTFGNNQDEEETASLKEWYQEMLVDPIKALLPVYDTLTEEYESSLGYPMNEEFTKELRKFSSKPKAS